MTNSKGFTLIELLLYIGVTATMLAGIAVLTAVMIQARVKNQAILEVEEQGQNAMHKITQVLRSAEGVNSPGEQSNSAELSVDVYDTSADPAVFSIDNSQLQITEGSGSAVVLTNQRVVVSDLTFSNLSYTDTPGTIRIEFTISHRNPENRQEFDYSKTFYGSASLR